MLTASVFINLPVKRLAKAFTYLVPENLKFLTAGWRVVVPFGSRKVEGFVVSVQEKENPGMKLKPIEATYDEEPWFTGVLLQEARWMSDFYLCSLAETMRLFMPGKSGTKIKVLYEARENEGHILLQVKRYAAVHEFLLQKGPQSKAQLEKSLALSKDDCEEILAKLCLYSLAVKNYEAEKRGTYKYETVVQLTAAVTAEFLAANKRKKVQCRLLQELDAAEKKQLTAESLGKKQFSMTVIHAAEKAGFVKLLRRRVLRNSYQEKTAQAAAVPLTAPQQTALAAITKAAASKKHQEFLLYGVTGSGKTQVYIEAAKYIRSQGRKVIVLVPEIALTGQMVHSFKENFSSDIVVMHSRLSVSERNDVIYKIRRNEAGVVIGARSALFTPVENVGLIVMDEEQDNSYKQDEAPRYHTRVAAENFARLQEAVLVLGSATPSLETYAKAQKGEIGLLTLPERIGGRPMPLVKVVDMREELRRGNRKILSRSLRDLIAATIAKGEQMIIMLNRRGFSTFVMCRSCGYVAKCRQCGLPLVYHRNGSLSCHHCDVGEPVPKTCPECHSKYIKFFGAGTEKLEQELQELVPQARVIRMDRDTTGTKFAHTDILRKFRNHEYDILLGTQMVAKGHDIPNVTAVGIISADASLNMPDYKSPERCFMLITQTAGRAGRGEIPGKVIVQSYNPEHYAVKSAVKQDYESFYQEEIKLRKELCFPPYSRLLKLTFQHEQEAKALAEAQKFALYFHERFKEGSGQQLLGPAPAAIANFRGIYRFCLLIKSSNLDEVRNYLQEQQLHLRSDVLLDIDPLTVL